MIRPRDAGDTGVGVPPENVQRVFDPFLTTKPPGEGTGLGLAISVDLVRRTTAAAPASATQ